MKYALTLLLVSSFHMCPLTGQTKSAGALFSSAVYEEEVSGNLEKAIEIYLEILQKFSEDRPTAAKTLYHLGLANEKLGRNKAAEYFNRLIDTYPEQSEWAALARKKIISSENKNVFTDPRDGHKYKYVTIGSQTWMAENLAYIPHVNPKMKGENGIWVYDYDGWDVEAAKATKNYETYGCLYDWPSAMGLDSTWLDKTWTGDPVNHQGICPPGWHMPTDEEWKELESSLGMPEAALNDIKFLRSGTSGYPSNLPEYPPVGRYLKADNGWNAKGNGDNRSGFNALPAGTRRESPPYYYIGATNWAYFWSATIANLDSASYPSDRHEYTAWSRELPGSNEDDYRMFSPFEYGQSVRCVQNQVGVLSVSRDLASNDEVTAIDKRSQYQAGLPAAPSSTNWSSRFAANNQNTGFTSGSAPQDIPDILWSVEREKINVGCLIANGRVFTSSLDSSLYSFDAETGKEIWRAKVNAPKVNLQVIECGYLIGTAGELDIKSKSYFIFLIDAESGKLIWESKPGPAIFGFVVADGIILYSRRDGYIVALNLRSKEILWEKKVPHDYSIATLAYESGQLIICSRSRNPSLTELDVDPSYISAWDSRTGKELWEFVTTMNINSTPAIHGNRVFFGCMDRNIYSIDLVSGLKSWRFYTGENIWATCSIAYDMVFTIVGRDNLCCLDAKTGRQIWKKNYHIEMKSGKHPAIADSLLVFCGRDSLLYGLNAFTGKELWTKKMPIPTASNPMIYNGRIYFVIGETLYAME